MYFLELDEYNRLQLDLSHLKPADGNGTSTSELTAGMYLEVVPDPVLSRPDEHYIVAASVTIIPVTVTKVGTAHIH